MSQVGVVYFARVMHRRLFPVSYRFSYPVFSIMIDLERISGLKMRLFSVNRFNLLSFYERDHGPRDGTPLRPWIDSLLRGRGIDLEGGTVRLLCFPRVLGYGFNPLSLWYCHHRDGSLRAVLCEVNNTFGEHHFYLLHEDGEALRWPLNSAADKCFHVSPLIGMRARYRFELAEPGDHLSVRIEQFVDDQLMLVATQAGKARRLSDRVIMQALARTPLMTFKVMAAIHWQALKIWLRGAPFFPKPEPPADEVT